MAVVPAFYVQDKDSGYFMRSDGDGGIDYVQLITDADFFDDRESAITTAADCLNQFVIFECWKRAR
ncbi:hypothetical protein [Silvimonas amylolytica]|uniref:Uncharacterized protein n=1 Tax=Silvimonas amylolytica TaxID=449663 RepID=A0ABQ2PRS6_9NEIS|nr:hypothetical protein [Silvimonas amylolytica]GGP24431.1 hypothetical protein GCM10010971_02500 [Silvimonas amylolytica]GGP28340.1 hypothetical protein GCM10010971_41590 [Silvimonas amylolytica]